MLNPPSGEQELFLLAERVHQGDLLAEEQLAVLLQRPIFLMMAARIRDREAARDLVQDVLMAVLRALRDGHVRKPEKLAAFVHGTARNLANNYLRAKGRQPPAESLSSAPWLSPSAGSQENTERAAVVREFLDRLEATDRKILLLSLVDGYTLAEIANTLQLSPAATRKRKSRALKKILEQVGRLSQK